MPPFIHRLIPAQGHKGKSSPKSQKIERHPLFDCPIYCSEFSPTLIPEGLLHEPEGTLLQVDGSEVLFTRLHVPYFDVYTPPHGPLSVSDPLLAELISMALGYVLQKGYQHFGRVEEQGFPESYRVIVTVPARRVV